MKHAVSSALSPARLLGAWERVRTSFWFVPALMALAAAASAYATVALDRHLQAEALAEPGWVWSGGPDGARSVLSTIAGSMATVAGVVFSVNIVALTLASSQFGPRLPNPSQRALPEPRLEPCGPPGAAIPRGARRCSRRRWRG